MTDPEACYFPIQFYSLISRPSFFFFALFLSTYADNVNHFLNPVQPTPGIDHQAF